jgi:hypothetical protein
MKDLERQKDGYVSIGDVIGLLVQYRKNLN